MISIIVAIDWYRHGESATKAKEYGFVLLAGIVASLFGLLNDLSGSDSVEAEREVEAIAVCYGFAKLRSRRRELVEATLLVVLGVVLGLLLALWR